MVAVRGKFVGTDNVPFGLAWRELKKQGWTSVRSRAKDLDPKWKYVRPGADPNGVKGVDFFHGEEELLEYYTADPLADTTDILNVDAAGGRDVDYNALKSGDEAAQDDVVTDAECDRDEWPSDASAMGESEANPEQDAMDIQLAKEFLDEFAGADAILAGNLMEKPLKEFSATGWGVIHEPNVYNELKTRYVPVENTGSYPGRHQGYAGPTPEVLHRGDSPMALFFYFMPVALWQHIAICSNKYQLEMLTECVDEVYRRHKLLTLI
ncbi:uncharacterized protein IUM83_11685 [Phytophthora cinnamomi]|uniref:uncharacterized protein n=1 Tax=Phytophthora cinnamomi TaxID=4785 RepID=UPI0035595724|nr:hypothetical protein IUM83_11685 [Phytophthora cinnamomi]